MSHCFKVTHDPETALIEGFNPAGIEMETDYLPLIQHRIDQQAGTATA